MQAGQTYIQYAALASNGPVHTWPLALQELVGKNPKPTYPPRSGSAAANAPRRGRSCTDQQHRQQNAQHHPHAHDQTARRHPGHTQHTPTRLRSDTQPPTLEAVQRPQPHTIRPPDSTKARPTIKPDRLFVLHDGTGHRPAAAIRQDATALSKPVAAPGRS